MQKNVAIAEAAKLRAHKETFVTSCWWCGITGLLLLVFLGKPFSHICTLIDLLLFLISVAVAYYHHGKPKTTLNKKQLKLFGIDHATVIIADGASSTVNINKTAATAESSSMNTSSTSLRHRIINTKQPLSSPSPAKSSHMHRTEVVTMGLTSNTEPRNFDVVNAESYKEASWREISEAVERRNNAGSNSDTSTSMMQMQGVGAYNAGGGGPLFGSPISSMSPAVAHQWQAYNTSPPSTTPSGMLMHMASPGGRLQPALQYGSKSIVKVKALAEIGLRDLSDKWVDQLRFILGKHLHKTLDSFDRTMAKAVKDLRAKGSEEPQMDALQNLLELKTATSGTNTIVGAIQYAANKVNPDLIKEYQSLDALLLLPSRRYFSDTKGSNGQTAHHTGQPLPNTTPSLSINNGLGGNFALFKGALARARELNRSMDHFLRISREPHAIIAAPLSNAPSDADMVLSIFLHLCDDLARKSSKADPYPPSHTLFSEDLAGVLQLSYQAAAAMRSGVGAATGAGPLVGVIRQSDMTGFSVFSANRSHVEILEVEEGRQNCFAALLVFLLQSLRVAVQTAATVVSTDTGGVKGKGVGMGVGVGGSPTHLQSSPAQQRFHMYRGSSREEPSGDPPVVDPIGGGPSPSSSASPSSGNGMGRAMNQRYSPHHHQSPAGRQGRLGYMGVNPRSREYPHMGGRGGAHAHAGQYKTYGGVDGDGGEYDEEDVSTERIARLSPLVRDLCLEVFQVRHLDDLVDYLASKGFDV